MADNFRLLKSDVKPLTRELAAEFRDLEPSPTEREINPARMKYLEKQAAEGLLITFQWATATLDGRTLRMNGQHSSNMLCNLDGHFPEGLYAHIDQYEVDDEAGLANLFRQFDARKSSRTAIDVAGAYQGLVPALRGLNKSTIKLGAEGLNWWFQHIEGVPYRTGDDQYQLFNDETYWPFFQWLDELFDIKTPEMRNKYVMAAMWDTFARNESEARKFWDQVKRGGLDYDDTAPSTKLDELLKEIKESKDKLKPGEYYQACVYAWNAYRDEKPIKNIRYDTKKGWLRPLD